MSKKILLLNPPGKSRYLRDYYCSHESKAKYYWQPYDLFVQSGILAKKYDVIALDANVSGLTFNETYRILETEKKDFDVVIFLTGGVSWREDFEFLKGLNERRKDKLIFIGIGDVMMDKAVEIMKENSFFDAALLDFTSDQIIDYLEGKRDNLSHMVFRKDNGEFFVGSIKTEPGEFSLPIPQYDLFPYKKYRIPHGIRIPFAGLITVYGCPYKCSYCIGGDIGFKYRNIENIMEELRYLKGIGIKELWIKDLTFAAKRDHSVKFCEELIKSGLGFSWVCISRVNVLDEELLKLMKRAGCHTIQLGVETADQELINRYSKGLKKEQVKYIFDLCKKIGIRTLAHFILGLPGDTKDNILSTIQYAIELEPDFASFNIAAPRLGTKFRKDMIEQGYITENVDVVDNSQSYPVYDTKELSRKDLWRLRNKAIKDFHLRFRYIFKRLFGIRSFYEFTTLFNEGFLLMKSAFK